MHTSSQSSNNYIWDECESSRHDGTDVERQVQGVPQVQGVLV